MFGRTGSIVRFGRGRLGRDDGNATVEFVILFPIFMVLFMNAFEIGLLMVRQVMLDRATDIVVRALRIGEWDDPTYAEVKTNICDEALILPNCEENLRLNLSSVDEDDWTITPGAMLCVDKTADIQPAVTFELGVQHEMMLVQVCALQQPFFPLSGLGLRLPRVDDDHYALMTQSAFVNEPG
ncbi:TadE/TadG family type IV pilus assembly protein [Aliiruegeria sabulilitoris]|uniref:TadE/TadG family type IV pilus assembly protein n=1 Tax=Aliiruegeria sabulilitoris TaxID=1510458 RepID=UPI0013D49C8B|nr:TadE/TadG family type IV pilus assembly protein [Aliiruegeria sabulilitoris]